MSIIFISGKISNGVSEISDEMLQEAHRRFYRVQVKLEVLGHTVINPMILDPIGDASWSSYMKGCIQALMNADYIYSMDGWQESKGSKIEHEVASMVDIPRFERSELI